MKPEMLKEIMDTNMDTQTKMWLIDAFNKAEEDGWSPTKWNVDSYDPFGEEKHYSSSLRLAKCINDYNPKWDIYIQRGHQIEFEIYGPNKNKYRIYRDDANVGKIEKEMSYHTFRKYFDYVK